MFDHDGSHPGGPQSDGPQSDGPQSDGPHGDPPVSQAAGDLPAVLRELVGALAVVDGVERGSRDGRELMDLVLCLEQVRRRFDATAARLLAELDRSEATVGHSGLRTKGWKAHRCHLPHSTVAREVRLGTTLERFGGLAAALGDGRISAEHVLAVANACNPRVEAALVEVQEQIIEFASRHRFSHFRSWLASLVQLLDADGPEPDHGEANHASMAADGEGNLHLVMALTGSDAVVAQHIIDTETDRQFRTARSESEATGTAMPTAQQLRARALVELLRRGAGCGAASTTNALEAVITVTTDTHGRPLGVHSSHGEEVDPVTAAVLLCDAFLQPVLTDTAADPLNAGRRQRLFSPLQHKSLATRDGGCVFPGCDQPPARCDAHHIHQWIDGGATDILNGVLLCRRHHRLEHSNTPWSLEVVDIDELSDDLAEQHRERARRAGRDPSPHVRIWNGPDGETFLAQTAPDHHAPPGADPQRVRSEGPSRAPRLRGGP